MPAPEISVIIVSFNTCDLLAGCLRSLRRVADEACLEVIVVDNASSDGSAEMVETEFPEAKVVRSGRNAGFATAMNLGIAASAGEFLFALNPDTLVPRETVRKLLTFIKNKPRAAVIGASLTHPDGRPQASTFGEPTLFREFWNFLPEIKSIFKPGRLGQAKPQGEPFQVEGVSGAAFLMRRDALRQVGGFDGEFVLYHEELDLFMRMRDAGWEIWTLPAAQVIHFDAQSSGYRADRLPSSPVLQWRIGGMDRLWKKHKSPIQHRLWRAQARGLLRLRMALVAVILPFRGQKGMHRHRLSELKELVGSLEGGPSDARQDGNAARRQTRSGVDKMVGEDESPVRRA
jgi:N-acetylglucosaminyl-diphospho-decaprenol L-rhamnosyltransferase